MSTEPTDEYRRFVSRLVPFQSIQEVRGGGFSDVAGRIARSGARGWSDPAILYGGGMMTAAAGLAALLPSSGGGAVMPDELSQLLRFGSALVFPLLIGAAALVFIGWIVSALRPDMSSGVLVAQSTIGIGSIALAVLIWIGVIAIAVFNFLVVALVLALKIAVGIVITIFFLGAIWGLITGQ